MAEPTPAPEPTPAAPVAPEPAPVSLAGAALPPATEPKSAEGEPKPGEPAPAAAFDPAALKLPEGFSVNPTEMSKFSELAKKNGLSQEAAQELVNLQAETLKAAGTAGQEGWTKTQNEWQAAVKADPEIGGAKLPATLQTISKAIDQYGTPGFKEALNITGAGNNPEIVKTFYKMAAALTEGTPARGNPPATAPQGGLEGMAARMYPSMTGNK